MANRIKIDPTTEFILLTLLPRTGKQEPFGDSRREGDTARPLVPSSELDATSPPRLAVTSLGMPPVTRSTFDLQGINKNARIRFGDIIDSIRLSGLCICVPPRRSISVLFRNLESYTILLCLDCTTLINPTLIKKKASSSGVLEDTWEELVQDVSRFFGNKQSVVLMS